MPVGIAESSLQLNLNGNFFQSTRLQKKNFTGLPMLEHLYLSDCGVEEIEEGAFSQMQRLRWLDLSNNRIKFLTSAVFRGLTLLHLFLNGNLHLHLQMDSFDGLLTGGLYLNECHLSKINPDVFSPLNSSLRYLWLDDNHFVDLDPQFEGVFSKLSHLRLGSNPLRCDCETVWLKNLFDVRQEIFKGAKPPSCGTPKRLELIQFNELVSSDFQCTSPSFGDVEAELSLDHARLKCTATGDPLPTLFWIQPSGQTTKYEPDANHFMTVNNKNKGDKKLRNFGVVERKPPQQNKTSRVETAEYQLRNEAVLYVDKRNVSSSSSSSDSISGMFICVAKNAAGNSTLAVKITWPPSTPYHPPPSVHFVDVITDKTSHVRPSKPQVPPASRGLGDSQDDDDEDGEDEDEEEEEEKMDGYDGVVHNQFRHHRKNPLILSHPSSRREKKPHARVQVQPEDSNQEEQSRKINTANFYLSNYTVLRVPVSDDFSASESSSEVAIVAADNVRLFSLAELICAIVGTHLCTLIVCLILAPLAMSIAKRWQRKLQATRLKSEIGGAAGLVDDVAGVWVKERVGDNPALNCGGFDRATACVQLSSSSRSSSDRSDIYSRCYPVETYNGITRYA